MSKGDDGYRAVDYGKQTAVSIEAVKVLKSENDALQMENNELKQRMETIEQRVGSN